MNKLNDYESILTDCLSAFTCPLGTFYPNMMYGSRIRECTDEFDEKKLLCCARQAVSDMDGVFVRRVKRNGVKLVIAVMINDIERKVVMAL